MASSKCGVSSVTGYFFADAAGVELLESFV
jgi:hypothetical protein